MDRPLQTKHAKQADWRPGPDSVTQDQTSIKLFTQLCAPSYRVSHISFSYQNEREREREGEKETDIDREMERQT